MKVSELLARFNAAIVALKAAVTAKAALVAENTALKAQVAALQAQLLDPLVPQAAADALTALETEIAGL